MIDHGSRQKAKTTPMTVVEYQRLHDLTTRLLDYILLLLKSLDSDLYLDLYLDLTWRKSHRVSLRGAVVGQ